MANQDAIDRARQLILTAQPDDVVARRTVWTVLNENDLLVGRVRMKEAPEALQKTVVRNVIAGDRVDSTTRSAWTFLPKLVIRDDALIAERLGMKVEEVQAARPFLTAMEQDL